VITATGSNNILTQGFQQPATDSLILSGDSVLIVIYTGLTPNGDNHNDTWIIDGIDTLQNTVHIFNRWGDLVWKGENYDNTNIVWDGTGVNSIRLPSGTYFYVIAIRNETHKGWVELTR
ncbi:MAG: gliding motility-associated C-terminal domain-containing protein, partial [Bacteroidota bacterium]